MRAISLLLGLSLAALVAGCGGSTAVKPEPLKKIAEPEVAGQTLWSHKTTGLKNLPGLRPLVEDERVIVASPRGRVTVLDAEGEPLQSVETGLRLSAGPTRLDDVLLFGTFDGEAVAVEIEGGAVRWRSKVSSEVLSPPAVSGSVVVVRSGDGRIYGLEAADGSRRWTSDRSVPALILRGTGSLVVDGDSVFTGLDNGRVLALSASTGDVLWEEVVSVPTGRSEVERLVDVDAELLLFEGMLFAASYGGDLVAIRPGSGSVAWRRTMSAYTGLDSDGQCIYVTDVDAVLWCLDPTSGGAFWKQEQLRHRGLSAPAAFKGNVVVGDFEGYVHWISAANGRIVGRMRAGSAGARVAPQVHNGRIYLFDVDGRLSVIDAAPISAAG